MNIFKVSVTRLRASQKTPCIHIEIALQKKKNMKRWFLEPEPFEDIWVIEASIVQRTFIAPYRIDFIATSWSSATKHIIILSRSFKAVLQGNMKLTRIDWDTRLTLVGGCSPWIRDARNWVKLGKPKSKTRTRGTQRL